MANIKQIGGYTSVTPYLQVVGTEKLIAFLTTAFGAREKARHMAGDKIAHAEVDVDGATIMMGEAGGDFPVRTAAVYLHVDNVDERYAKALELGGKTVYPPADNEYGDRSAGVEDPFGNCWYLWQPLPTSPAAAPAVPENMEGAVPYLCVSGAARALDFYRQAFGAVELMRLAEPGCRVAHAEFQIGKALVMISDEYPEIGVRSPTSIGGTAVTIHVSVPDVDAFFERAIASGAELERAPKDEFYGARAGCLRDPFGHRWHIGTPKENVPVPEIERRYSELTK
ncbi:MAG TPA: VOC family protein [Bryobacteraceae bacterium]|nr:VOC family protein [Bryobacteraceae bacterium]